MIERLQDSDGLGAILPAMANSVLALATAWATREDRPAAARGAARTSTACCCATRRPGPSACSPACRRSGTRCSRRTRWCRPACRPTTRACARAASWLLAQADPARGRLGARNPVPPGGWYFEYRNEFYPDVDDTCMALMVLRQARAGGARSEAAQEQAIARGLTWMLGMQNRDGGWASFDRDNDKQWLTQVPFADHNAMIDPSTADITGRVLECLSHFPGFGAWHPVGRARDALPARPAGPTGAGTAAGA